MAGALGQRPSRSTACSSSAPPSPITNRPSSSIQCLRRSVRSLCTVEPVDGDLAATNDQAESSDECSRAQPGTRVIPGRTLCACVEPARRRRGGSGGVTPGPRRQGTIVGAAFDEAYAVARLTPGTNLLAMSRSWANASLAGEALSSPSPSGRSFRRSSLSCWVPSRRLRWAFARARGHAGRPGWCHRRVRVGNRETRSDLNSSSTGAEESQWWSSRWS